MNVSFGSAASRRGGLPGGAWLSSLQVAAATWIFVCSFVGYPAVAVAVTLASVESRVLTLPYRALILGMALSIFASSVKQRLRGRVDRMLLVFLVLYLFRLLYDLLTTEILGNLETLQFYTVIVFLPTLAVAAAGVAGRSDVEIARRLVGLGGIMLLMASIAWALGRVSNSWHFTEDGAGRLGFDALNPISLGHAAASTMIACIFLLTTKTTTLKWKIVSGAVMVLGAFILFKASSKGPFLALILAVMWYGSGQIKRAAKLLPLLLVLPFLGPGFESMFEKTVENLSGGWASDESSLLRLTAQRLAIEDFLSSPLLGKHHFNDSMGSGLYPHNLFFEVPMALGLVGLTLYVALHIRTVRNTFSFYAAEHPMLVMLLIQYFLNTQLSGAIWGSDTFFALLALNLSSNTRNLSVRRRSALPYAGRGSHAV
jgi:hypothetical protein